MFPNYAEFEIHQVGTGQEVERAGIRS